MEPYFNPTAYTTGSDIRVIMKVLNDILLLQVKNLSLKIPFLYPEWLFATLETELFPNSPRCLFKA